MDKYKYRDIWSWTTCLQHVVVGTSCHDVLKYYLQYLFSSHAHLYEYINVKQPGRKVV